jgi:hypothetical protein
VSGAEFAEKDTRQESAQSATKQPARESRLVFQPKLVVGSAGDPLEAEADAVAMRVLAEFHASHHDDAHEQVGHDHEHADAVAVHSAGPIVSRSAGPAGGFGGGDVDAASEQAVQRALGRGSSIPTPLRRRYERAFGADFSSVRVHNDSESAGLNHEFGARAFTVGNDIFLGKGAPSLDSDAGVKLMSHELTHTLQQTPQAHRVQRDIGFEFETKALETKQTTDGAGLPNTGFATPKDGKEAFEAAKRIKKGDALLKRGDLEVQADDWGSKSDMEVVVTHLPENAGGRTRLVNALRDLNTLINGYDLLAATGGGFVPAEALNGTANFTTPLVGGMLKGNWTAASTMPQVTMGLRVGNIVDIVEDLHGSAFAPQTKQEKKNDAPRVGSESGTDKTSRDPGRRRFRGDMLDPTDTTNKRTLAEPKNLSQGNESHTLVLGLTLAKESVAKYHAKHDDSPVGKDIEGFLTIVFAYAEGGRYKGAFLKSHTPLMAKTDLVTIWDQLPQNVRDYYGKQVTNGNTRLEEVIATAGGYSGRLDKPLILVKGLADENTDDTGNILPNDQLDWYQSLIMRDWVRSICITQQRTKWQKFRENFVGTQSRTRVDKLTTANFPNLPTGKDIEGYSALGNKMDTDETVATKRLPVFELRSGSRPVLYTNLEQWATDVFDYITSLNANPTGGHTKISGAPPI